MGAVGESKCLGGHPRSGASMRVCIYNAVWSLATLRTVRAHDSLARPINVLVAVRDELHTHIHTFITYISGWTYRMLFSLGSDVSTYIRVERAS